MDSAVSNPVSSATFVMDQRAFRACGSGFMGDLVTPSLLQAELEDFYRGDPQSSAAVSLLRLLSALDSLLALPVGSSGSQASQMQLLWEFVSIEQALSIIHTPSSDVGAIHRFTHDKDPDEMLGYMRTLRSAMGQPKLEPLAVLENGSLGPLQWWLAAGEFFRILFSKYDLAESLADNILSDRAMRRRDIYDSALRLFGPNILPSLQASPTGVVSQSASNFDFVAGSLAETGAYAGLGVRRNSSPDMQASVGSTAAAASRRLVSPWLAPREFQGEITWRIEDLNQLVEDLLHWPSGQSIPDALIWEHPAMHGCLVDATGHTAQFQVRCSVCERLDRRCYWRGAKACLPCFWEKASKGSCTGAVPPVLMPAQEREHKPQLARRMDFLWRLEGAGVTMYPEHLVDANGRAV
ncbi:unnamed protein product [Peniophora sp. CBMAI 1063]|nr:unnamed protein product [Peniophora sp. CBMAI 1063]